MDLARIDGLSYFKHDLVLLIKLFSTVMVVLMAYLLGNDSATDLERFLIDHPTKKLKVLMSQISLMVMLMLWQIAVLLTMALAVHRFITPYALDLKFYLDLYLALVQLNAFYLFFTFLLLFFFRSVFMVMPSLALFWFMAMTPQTAETGSEDWSKLIQDVVPNLYLSETGIQTTGRFSSYLIIMLLMASVMVLLKINQDIK